MSDSIRNRVQLIGSLGDNPIIRTTKSGRKFVKFSMAVNESYVDNLDRWVNRTHWHYVTAWGRLAEFVEKQFSKGMEVVVEGKLISTNYTDKDGVRRYSVEVRANEILFFRTPKPNKEATSLGNVVNPIENESHGNTSMHDLPQDVIEELLKTGPSKV